jgi:lipid A oxidase
MKNSIASPTTLAIAAAIAGAASARAEWVVSAFTGSAMTENTDVKLRQPGTDLTFHDASFEGRDFESPFYYGGRVSYFLEREQSSFGFGAEFFHAKAYLNSGDTVHVTGTRGGLSVDDQEPISNSIQQFNNSHGLNYLTADAMYRWVFSNRDKSFIGRLQPYLGAGIGVVIPHVESDVGGLSFQEYQVHGPGVVAFGGLNFDITKHFSIFAEYKFSYSDLDEPIPGGSISYTPLTHNLIGGFSINF